MTARLLFATTNLGKLAELKALLGSVAQVLSLEDFAGVAAPAENGETFEENARLKAEAYARATGVPALADDSGLCVDALGGRPGIHSARYAPGDDSARVDKLLSELAGFAQEQRGAAFQCALCLARPKGRSIVEVGECRGLIAELPRGRNGFGYDPVFYLPERGKTMAELSGEEKSVLSHRGQAFRKMRPYLVALKEG